MRTIHVHGFCELQPVSLGNPPQMPKYKSPFYQKQEVLTQEATMQSSMTQKAHK